MIPSAYLRVFLPLDAFHDEERATWERYIVAGGSSRPPRPVYHQRSFEPDRSLGLLQPADAERAEIRVVDGRYYVCPWRTRLRVLAGILSSREESSEVSAPFIPEEEIRRAARELARLKRRDGQALAFMLQSPWHVPVRWFLLVGDEERGLVECGPGEYRLYYWTPIERARRRAHRARLALRHTELVPSEEGVGELAEWLSAFPEESVVELDYGSVASLFSWDELDDDHSGREMQQAVEALRWRSGAAKAGELYEAVVGRWAEVRSRESLN